LLPYDAAEVDKRRGIVSAELNGVGCGTITLNGAKPEMSKRWSD
jgi:hypothetical protein